MAKLTTDQLLDAFKELTLIELSEFVKKFEETFEVTAAAPVAVAAAGGGAAAPVEEVEEKDSFDVVLEAAGEKKIQVIKEVRALTSLGLGEAKALVDGAPGVVLEGANKETLRRQRPSSKRLAPPSRSSSSVPARGCNKGATPRGSGALCVVHRRRLPRTTGEAGRTVTTRLAPPLVPSSSGIPGSGPGTDIINRSSPTAGCPGCGRDVPVRRVSQARVLASSTSLRSRDQFVRMHRLYGTQ